MKRADSTAIQAARKPLGLAVISYVTLVCLQYFAEFFNKTLCTEYIWERKPPFCEFLLKFIKDCQRDIQENSKTIFGVNSP